MNNATSRASSRRQSEIAALLRETGRVAVEELAAHFTVTPQMIRRDLNEMSAARLIPNNSSLFINIGTTTEEVARAVGRSTRHWFP